MNTIKIMELVTGALKLAGTATPAFRALFDGIITPLKEQDQIALKNELERAMARSDALHNDVQRHPT